MGAGKYDNTHGVGILLNKKWKQRIIDTEYINERTISTTIVVNRQRIKLMSVYFLHSGYADHHIVTTLNMRTNTVRRCSKQSRNTWCTVINTFQSLEEILMLSWDLEKERNVKLWADKLSTRVIKEVTI